ncbi:cytochrome P450 9e2-like isoform X2 [Monomorium pharaonis]|uniref:cytochrome P450 9e2-like isoform X2 n=1 Tax=Monomorium pharaonis TaxID=307658 RepID=UPI001745E7F3|nr:cytochrome P450 9e2-like isoform X2 [Monomorium pharaonis]
MDLSSTFVLLLVTLIVIGVLKIISVLHHAFFYWKNKGLPYMPDSFSSFLMNWKVVLGYTTFSDYCQYMYSYFPNAKYIGIVDFVTPGVLLRDPKLIKEIMVRDFEHFPDHRPVFDESVDPLFSKSLSALRGDRWREMRNILSPSFTASKMKFIFELISKCSRDFVNYLVDHPELCQAIETKGAFRRYATDVIATTAFGINVNSMKDRDNEFYVRGVEATKFPTGVLIMIKFIFIKSCPRLAKSLGMSFFPPATLKFFMKIVGETVKAREEQGIVRPDMIHLLLQARNKENASTHKMALMDIVSQAFIFFLAGFETFSTLISFVAHELAVNQDIQDRLREEIQQYLTKENAYALHHDSKYFPNPSKFDPERFSEQNKDNILPYSYLPFGEGPRKCIGNRFALMETKILIARLLQKFTLKTTEKTVEPIVFSKNEFSLHPVNGFWISLEKRET